MKEIHTPKCQCGNCPKKCCEKCRQYVAIAPIHGGPRFLCNNSVCPCHKAPEKNEWEVCPTCGGPADNGNDRSFPPNAYECTKCAAPERKEKIERGAEDFANRFEGVMKELAEEECDHDYRSKNCDTCVPHSSDIEI